MLREGGSFLKKAAIISKHTGSMRGDIREKEISTNRNLPHWNSYHRDAYMSVQWPITREDNTDTKLSDTGRSLPLICIIWEHWGNQAEAIPWHWRSWGRQQALKKNGGKWSAVHYQKECKIKRVNSTFKTSLRGKNIFWVKPLSQGQNKVLGTVNHPRTNFAHIFVFL